MGFRGWAVGVMVVAAAGAALADGVVAPEAFEAMSEGRTLYFSLDGEAFGAEQYFPGRRSLWRFADGTCDRGRWRAEGERICFVYERTPWPQCWIFLRRGEGYTASLVQDGAEAGLVLELSGSDTEPLACPGPDVGS
jgi:hypothetical protein